MLEVDSPVQKMTSFTSTFWILLLFLLVIFARSEIDSSLLIETGTGLVRGKIVIGHTQKEARAFFGIPYAEPPIEQLRFKHPVPVKPWTSVLDGTQAPLPCYQQYTRGSLRMSKKLGSTIRRPWSEDCLTLSIWTKAVTQLPLESPTFVIFHGGEFMTGTGVYPYIDLSTFSVESDVIHVSVNYRLGAFGFLSLGLREFPGNLGLLDQHLALKWIHSNVHKFGGNPDAILLFGFEAGAASIGHQINFSENEGLFKTAVIINGSPTCAWAWQSKETAIEISRQFSQNLDCYGLNKTSEIECLQKAHPEDILDASFFEANFKTEYFKPNIDGFFIKERPSEAVEAGKLNVSSIIIATSENPQSLMFLSLNEDILTEPGQGLTAKGFEESIKCGNLAKNDVELGVIRDWYLREDHLANSREIRDVAVQAYSDALTVCCSNEYLNLATKNGLLTFKIVNGITDQRFPSWIGAHSQMLHSVLTGETFNTNHEFGEKTRNDTFGVAEITKIIYRKPPIEFRAVAPIYNVVDQPYSLWKTEAHFLNNHRRDECVLWNEVLPAMRNRKETCSRD